MICDQEEQGSIALMFKQISIAFSNHFQRLAARYDLTPSQASLLIYLSKANHPVNQREIERYLRFTNPTVTGLVQRMESKGFLRREISESDSRAKHLILTDKAREISSEVQRDLQEAEAHISAALSDGEKEQLRLLLSKVLHSMCSCDKAGQCGKGENKKSRAVALR